ncbi:MAG: cyclase family protein [Kutzneria sp.]|nr:cyclase family protein [Kutzneria sp.]MBV9847237.1 cyclase family protein [Kutzneria sp.]
MSAALLDIVRNGVTVYDLAQPLEAGIPTSVNHPGFRMALQRRHGDTVRPDGSSAANELIVTGGHVGTHIDALCHASFQGRLHGGYDAEQAQRTGRFEVHGVETIRPFVCRGVLLDIAAVRGVDVLGGDEEITAEDLENACLSVNARPGAGEVALIRTGWARHWTDASRYLGADSGVPGVGEAGARWLAERGIAAAGADTTAFEHIPAGQGHLVMPVHRILLVEHGIHIIEHLDLESLSAAGVREFLFVLSPLRIVGATGSPVRPLAVTEGARA